MERETTNNKETKMLKQEQKTPPKETNELTATLVIGKQIDKIFEPAIMAKNFTDGNVLSNIFMSSPYSIQIGTTFEFTKDDLAIITKNTTPEEQKIITNICKKTFGTKKIPDEVTYQEIAECVIALSKNENVSPSTVLTAFNVFGSKIAQKQQDRSKISSRVSWASIGLGFVASGFTLAGYLIKGAPGWLKIVGLCFAAIFAIMTVIPRTVNTFDRTKNQNNYKILKQIANSRQVVFDMINTKLKLFKNKNIQKTPAITPETQKQTFKGTFPPIMPFKIDNKKNNQQTIQVKDHDVEEEKTNEKKLSNPFTDMFANLFKNKTAPGDNKSNPLSNPSKNTMPPFGGLPPLSGMPSMGKPPMPNGPGMFGMPNSGGMPPFGGLPPLGSIPPIGKPPMPGIANDGIPPLSATTSPQNSTTSKTNEKQSPLMQNKQPDIKELMKELQANKQTLKQLQSQKQALLQQQDELSQKGINNSTDTLQGLPFLMQQKS